MEHELNNEVVVTLMLCESKQVLLKPNQLYTFEVDENCTHCKELEKLSDY